MLKIKQLEEMVLEKQKEVQDICNSHYQDFVNCIDSLLQLRVEATELQDNLKVFENELNNTGDVLVAKTKEHIKLLKASENIRRQKNQLKLCLNIFYKTQNIQHSLDSNVVFFSFISFN